MSSNIALIFLIIFAAEISLGNCWIYRTQARKVEFSENEKDQVRAMVKDFLDFVTLNETETFWNESNFQTCFNSESASYNFILEDFKKDISVYLDKYRSNSRSVHQNLIADLKDSIGKIKDLIDKARNNVFLGTQTDDFDRAKVKQSMEESKKQIESCIIKLNENVWSIEKSASTESQKKELEKTKEKIKEEFEKVKKAAVQFIKDMKTCMKI